MVIVNDLHELNAVLSTYPRETVGWSGVHHNMHDGHRYLHRVCRANSDISIGMYFSNFAYQIERLMGGPVAISADRYSDSDVDALSKIHDIVFVWKDDYFPTSIPLMRDRLQKEFSDSRLHDLGCAYDPVQVGSFRGSQALVILCNDYFRYTHSYAGFKDAWRVPYSLWYNEQYPGKLVLVEAQYDKNGNCFSGSMLSMPKDLLSRINKRLLLPTHRSIEEVRDHVKDIDGLEVMSFFDMRNVTGTLHARFKLGSNSWNEGCYADHNGSRVQSTQC
jgi:hypothetical protein